MIPTTTPKARAMTSATAKPRQVFLLSTLPP
jgi:hypothetical protein